MQNSQYITRNKKGIAMSIDALLALIIFIAMVAFISTDPASELALTQPRLASNQLVDDIVTAMDGTGFIMNNIYNGTPEEIEQKMQDMLPISTDFNIEFKKYGSGLDISSACREDKDFTSCFPTMFDFDGDGTPEANPQTFFTGGNPIPENKEIFHGKKIFVKKEPSSCTISGALSEKKSFTAYFQGNHSPEARDVNITTETVEPWERNPCPDTDDIMRCKYRFYDEDVGDIDAGGAIYRWYKYDNGLSSWELTEFDEQTVALDISEDGNRWRCNVKVKDDSGDPDTEWSDDADSMFAIVGGPCFFFESSVSPEPMECGVESTVSYTLSAQAGGRRTPVDIMMAMDRSGSMAWTGTYNGVSGSRRSVFTDNDSNYVFFGTSSYVYRLDANMETGGLSWQSGDRTVIDDALGLHVDGDYVLVADNDAGLSVINKNTMVKTASITDITSARELDVSGNYAFVVTNGSEELISSRDSSAKVTGVVEEPSEPDLNSLDVDGGYMVVGNGNPDWGSTRGTISFWVNRDLISSNDRYWGQHNNMEIRYSSGYLTLDWGTASGSSYYTISIPDPLTETGKWYFVAITWDEIANTLYLYVGDEDNTPSLAGSNTNWTRSLPGVYYENNFMRSGSHYGAAVNGKGDELRYYDTDRSLTEIQADYKQKLTSPLTEPNLVSYFKLDGDFTDSGDAGDTGTGVGTYEWSSDTPLGATTQVEYKSLDAEGGYMVVGNGNPDWGSTRGTISFWVNRDLISSNDRYWGQHNNMEIRYSSGYLTLDWGTASGSSYYTISIPDPLTETGKWYFVAITWDEIANTLYLYVGDEDNTPSLAGSNTNWTRSLPGVYYENNFMRSGSHYGAAVNGKGDELRYYDTDRSLTEIIGDYDIELTGNETALVSYFNLNGDFVDLGPAEDDGYSVGSTSWSTDTPMPSFSSESQIGYNSSQNWAAQSFKPTITSINKIYLPLIKQGSPSGNITVHIRQSINGTDLTNGTATILGANVGTNLSWLEATFPNNGAAVVQGQTYYIAVTTTGTSSSNYYKWPSVKEEIDVYSNGTLWECDNSVPSNCTTREPPNQTEYEDAGFQIFYEGIGPAGLVIIDISNADPNNWFVEGSLYDTGDGIIQGNDIEVSGNYAYISEDDDEEGLWIVDISDTTDPEMESFLEIDEAVAVAASGNYAYVIEEESELYIIDVQDKGDPVEISTGIGDLDDVTDIQIDGTRAYVTANGTGNGATENGVHVIDITSPATASLIETFYMPYGEQEKIFVGETFAYVINSSYDLFTFDKIFGPKINMARDAAQEFILFEDWNAPEDQLGIISYADYDYTLNSPLLEATGANKTIINTAIDGIMAYGNTPLAIGLRESLDELETNGVAGSVQFIILLADGECNSGCSDLTNQINRARTNEVYVFTIGFGGNIGASEETQMRSISDGAYCGESGTDCGTYYHASNPTALIGIYEIISLDIAKLSGLVPDGDETNMTMTIDRFKDIVVDNCIPDPGIGQCGTTISYTGIDIRTPWTGSFDITIPCDFEDCGTELQPGTIMQFPPQNTEIVFAVESEVQDYVYWPAELSSGGELEYIDLELEFLKGKFESKNLSIVDYSIKNIGYEDIDLTDIRPTVEFYVSNDSASVCDAIPGELKKTEDFVDELDAMYGAEASGAATSTDKVSEIPDSGWICGWLNRPANEPDDRVVKDCSENNKFVINCNIPETFIYTMDYWAWEK